MSESERQHPCHLRAARPRRRAVRGAARMRRAAAGRKRRGQIRSRAAADRGWAPSWSPTTAPIFSSGAGRLYARAPARLAGLIEIRGVGIVELPHAPTRRASLWSSNWDSAGAAARPSPSTARRALWDCLRKRRRRSSSSRRSKPRRRPNSLPLRRLTRCGLHRDAMSTPFKRFPHAAGLLSSASKRTDS